MDGTRLMNISIVLWLMIRTMQLIYVPPLPVRPGKGVNRNRMSDQPTNLTVINPSLLPEDSMPRIFFEALAKEMHSQEAQQDRNRVCQESVSTATRTGILPDSAHSREPLQRQSAPPRKNSQRHSNEQRIDTEVTNEVEYNFEIINSYEIKSGNNIVNVKGNLKKNLFFWKYVLQANDFILNTVEFGYRIPFFNEPCSVYLSNNRSALNHASFVEK